MMISLPDALLEALTPPAPMPGQAPEAGLWLADDSGADRRLDRRQHRDQLSRLASGHVGRRGPAPRIVAMPILLGRRPLDRHRASSSSSSSLAVVAVMIVPGAMAAAQSGIPARPWSPCCSCWLLVLIPIGLYFGARLMVMTPVGAAETGGPFAAHQPQLGADRGAMSGSWSASWSWWRSSSASLTGAIRAVAGIIVRAGRRPASSLAAPAPGW